MASSHLRPAALICVSVLGYAVNFWHLNSADYGVPQTRKRLILVASLDHMPRKPLPTHCNPARRVWYQADMFALPDWNGWHGAIADIAHTLPDSQFAPWQVERLPARLRTLLISGGNTAQEWGKGYRDREDPIFTITALVKPSHLPRALLVDGQNQSSVTQRNDSEPAFSITDASKAYPRALLIGGGNTNKTIIDSTYRDGVGRSYTVTAASSRDRAFICDGQANAGGTTITTRHGEDPIFTVGASADKRPARAYIGRVVSATPRALARWQSVPDSYMLPEKTNLACKIIGNMVPPLLMQRVIEANL